MWGVVSASLHYSCRFNDEDLFHKLLWSAFLVGMLFQQVYLYHNLAGFATTTAALYLLVVLAHLRVAALLPRARGFCLLFSAGHMLAALPLILLAVFPDSLGGHERAFLWWHLLGSQCSTLWSHL